ncbi:DUF6660 family protein [Flavobacterium sp. LB3P122]|uniref:DUF6660 family protein n=1 Tax=Flavobacterium algoriphilum TaxID=3398738 RepID=UPI003A878571
MRIVNFILSIYFIILSCMPCVDIVYNYDSNSGITIVQQEQKQENHQEICSPFCICSCCGQQIVFQASNYFAIPTQPVSSVGKETILYIQKFVSNFNGTIWQPPKVSNVV